MQDIYNVHVQLSNFRSFKFLAVFNDFQPMIIIKMHDQYTIKVNPDTQE